MSLVSQKGKRDDKIDLDSRKYTHFKCSVYFKAAYLYITYEWAIRKLYFCMYIVLVSDAG